MRDVATTDRLVQLVPSDAKHPRSLDDRQHVAVDNVVVRHDGRIHQLLERFHGGS
jgi:hypothetical protein